MAKSQFNDDSDTKESESEDEVFDFVIIEFIKRGRKTKDKRVHVVPSSWLNYDNKKKHYTCPFPLEPHKDLDNMVKDKLPSNESWNIYNVKVKGHDDDYKQAKKNAKKLQIKDNAFSTDSDFNSNEKTKQIQEAVKIRVLKESLAAMEKNMDLSNNNEHLSSLNKDFLAEHTSSDDAVSISETESSSSQASSKKKKLANKPKSTKASVHQKPLDNSETIIDNFELTSYPTTSNSYPKEKIEPVQKLVDSEVSINAYIDNNGSIVVSDINKRCQGNYKNFENKLSNVTGITQEQFIELMEKLTCFNVELKTQTASIHRIENILEQQHGYTSRRGVTNQFGPDFPIKEIDKLRDIDEQLKDYNFKMKLINTISSVIDLDDTLSVNATEVLKKIIKRELAMQFTAARQMDNKFVFCLEAPNLYNYIRESLSSYLQKNPKKVMSSLGTAFTNSKDWDGHRADRIKEKKDATPALDSIDA